MKISDGFKIIQPEFTTYNIFASGYSVPIAFDLSEMIPFDNVSVLIEIAPLGTDPLIYLVDDNNSIVPQLSLDFTPTMYKARIRVKSTTFMTATPAHNSILKMTIYGTDARSFVAYQSNIVLQLISSPLIPALSYTQVID